MKPASIVSRRAITLLCLVTIGGPVCADPIITTVAGGGPDDLPAVAATLNSPADLAVDGSGNLYVIANGRIFRITPNGHLFVHAGRGAEDFAGDGGPARQANISSLALAADEAGNIFIADSYNNRIRRVDASTGIITTIAGTGAPGFGGDGGPATSATLGNPIGVAIDHAGNVYFSADNRVRRIDAITGIVTTVAGTGALSYSGDGGPAIAATFFVCAGLAFDGGGNLHVVDGNLVIRRVDAVTGIITTVAGNGTQQAGGAGADGQPATSVGLFYPNDIALDASDNLFISDGGRRIRRVDAVTRIITTVAGGGATIGDGGPATEASLSNPRGVAVDQAGHLYIGDTDGRIRKVDATTGLIGTFAGGGTLNTMPDGLPATRLSVPILSAAAVDPWGNLYMMSTALLRVDGQTGRFATIGGAGTDEGEGVPIAQARLSFVKDLEFDTAGNLYVLEGGFHVEPGPVDPGGFFGRNRVRRIDAVSGLVTTVAGTGFFGLGAENVPATSSPLGFPEDIALDAQGDIYIVEGFDGMTGRGGNRVRRVSAATGLINTIAGGGYPGFGGDGGPATAAYLSFPMGVAVDRITRDVYIADTFNYRVRRIDANTGIIDTVAGDGSYLGPFVPDGIATLTPLIPFDLTVDGSGHVYIAEPQFTSARILRLDVAAGLLARYAGTGVKGSWGDGGPALEAHISGPHALTLDPDGNLLFVEQHQNRIRQVGLGGLSNRPPEASAGSDAVRGCAPSGAEVTLDGSGSVDADSLPGDNDDIVSFEWYEDFGRSTQSLLGAGEELVVALLPGEHSITLRVEDRRGLSDLDDVKVTVLDSVDVDPPRIDLAVLPDRLWPPNHHLVDVTASVGASDDCGAVTVVLESIVSSEPEDAPGLHDGATHDDIQDADFGTTDFTFRLRAERESGGLGRAYTITYRATDPTGNTATASAVVAVPHDMSGASDPVRIDLRETPAGTLVLWDPVPGARFYNVVRGDLAGISTSNEAIELGLLRCVEAGSTDTSTAGLEDAERPSPGASFFYLAEFDDGRPSTHGAPDAALPRLGSPGCDP